MFENRTELSVHVFRNRFIQFTFYAMDHSCNRMGNFCMCTDNCLEYLCKLNPDQSTHFEWYIHQCPSGKMKFKKCNFSKSISNRKHILDMIDHQMQVCIRMDNRTDMSREYFHRFPNINCKTYALHTRQCLNDRKHFEFSKSRILIGIQVLSSDLHMYDCYRSNGIQFHNHIDKIPSNWCIFVRTFQALHCIHWCRCILFRRFLLSGSLLYTHIDRSRQC